MPRPLVALASLLVLLVTARPGQAQGDAATRAAWNVATRPFKIAGNVAYVGAAGVSAYLITTPAGHILVDGGLPETARQIAANVAALGFRLEDVKFIVNSHAHFDHAGGLAELKKRTHAALWVSRPDAAAVRAGKQLGIGAHGEGGFPPVAVDHEFDDGATITLGGSTLTAHLTPGHTPGCTSWTLPIEDGGRRLNVLFYCSTSFPGYTLVDNASYPSIAADYARSFSILAALPCDVFLAPHPSQFGMDQKRGRLAAGQPNPFIDRDESARVIGESRRAFEQELAAQEKLKHERKQELKQPRGAGVAPTR